MIKIHKGNLLANVNKGIIVHGCNAQGVFNAGFAKGIRQMYPEAYRDYMNEYKESYHGENFLALGSCVCTEVSESLIIISAITQEFYGREPRRYVDYDAVRSCFNQVSKIAFAMAEKQAARSENNIVTVEEFIPAIHFPMIGAGLGGGNWGIIEKIIDEELDDRLSKNLWVLE